MIHVECPDCSKAYDVAEELAGKAAKCRECGGRIPIPQLRTDSDAPTARAKPVQPKPVPTKSPSSKATTPPPAKPKPTAKPKPAPKKPEDDFFEDDFEEVAEFDDVEVEVEEEWDTPRRSPSRRKKKSGSAAKQYGRIGAFVASGTGKLAWRIWLIGMFVVALVGFLFFVFFAIGFCLRPNLISGVIGAVMFGMLWLGFKGVRGKGIPVGPDYTMEGFSAELIGSLLVLVSNPFGWFVILMLVGFVRLQNGMLVVGPQQNAPIAQPAPINDPSQPGTVATVTGAAFDLSQIPIPQFENLQMNRNRGLGFEVGGARSNPPNGVRNTTPGVKTNFTFFQPLGNHAPQSLPCILTTRAGTNLLHGTRAPELEPGDLAEIRPYLEAGFAVLGVSLDGPVDDLVKDNLQVARLNYQSFRQSGAGVVNIRNGIEFLRQRVSQVDPNRVYVAGHSSAGTLALLAAAQDSRIKGCVAFAPVSDVEAHLKPLLDDRQVSAAFEGLADFAKQSSPKSHATRIKCPVFLFHANDDSIVSVSQSIGFEAQLKANRIPAEFVRVPSGNHYDSMIQQGIPQAIPWLKQLAGMSGAGGASAPQVSSPNTTNSAVPKGAELPAFPNFGSPNVGLPAGVLQPSGRAVTFRYSTFSGKGDPGAAARQALRNVSWADLNDIVIDQATSEIRIGQLGGSVNSEPARQALLAAGFQLVGGVSIGAKKPASSTTTEPARPANSEPAASVTSTPAENPLTTKTPTPKAATKPAAPVVTAPAAPKESGPPRRVVTFRYERYSGKGSSTNAAVTALKKVKWTDPDDIEVDAAKREIRVGQLEESKEYGPAEKSLKDAGFSLAPGVTSGLRKR